MSCWIGNEKYVLFCQEDEGGKTMRNTSKNLQTGSSAFNEGLIQMADPAMNNKALGEKEA